MPQSKTQKSILAGMLIAVGLLLPYVTAHGFGVAGNVLLPMHIPVLLSGLICGPFYGSLCGLIIPLLSSAFTGMPVAYPMLPIMMGELFTYGLMSGVLLHKTKLGKLKGGIYPALIGAMLCGRLVYGVIFSILMLLNGQMKALSVSMAIVTGIPGIILQLILIPTIVMALAHYSNRAKRVERQAIGEQDKNEDVEYDCLKQPIIEEARQLISEGKASCVVIRKDSIVRTENERGIQPIITLYDAQSLEGAIIVDKIIGKAAAMILILGNVKAVYGENMSKTAKSYLEAHHIEVKFDRCIDVINNREGNGICPMERAVMGVEDPEEALEILRATLLQLRKKA